MGRSRPASAPQYVGKLDDLRGSRASGAVCRQDQRCDGVRCPIILLGPPRLCAGLCHRDSMASHGIVGRFIRRIVANPLASSVVTEAPSRVRAVLRTLQAGNVQSIQLTVAAIPYVVLILSSELCSKRPRGTSTGW